MPQIDSNRSKPATAVLTVLLASLALAACGGSTSTSSTSASASASATTTTNGGGAAFSSRFKALRECLAKNGVTLPTRKPGQPRQGGGADGLPGGGPQLPAGVTRAQYEAAVKKCGGNPRARLGGGARLSSPAFKQALAKFATCMGQNGVSLPAPNTSGNGPIFNTGGVNTASAKFKTAAAKCDSMLRSAFPPRPGGSVPPGASAP
jgi:hypothetical protein